MGAGIDEIRVCKRHQATEKVPLIFTMAFPGNEYWCPGCGALSGVLGAGDIVVKTPELEKSAEEWRKKGKDYLYAKAVKVCSSVQYNGSALTYEELPETEKKRLQKIEDNWKYKYADDDL